MAMFNLGLPLYGKRLGLGTTQIALAKGAATLPYVFMSVLAGRFSDRWGRWPIAILGCLTIAIFFGLVPLTTGLFTLLAVCAGVSFCQGFFWPPFQGWFGDAFPGPQLPRKLVFFNLSWSVGLMAGLLVGGYLFEVSAGALFLSSAGGAVAAAAVLMVVPRRVREPESGGERESRSVSQATHRRYLRAHRTANFVSYFCISNVITYFPLRASEMGWSPSAISNVVFVLGGVYVIMFPVMGIWSGWHYRPYAMVAAQALACVGVLGLGWGRSGAVLLPCLASVGLMLSVSYASSLYYSVSSEKSRGTQAGWHESLLRMGEFLGGVTGGLLAGLLDDIRLAFVLCAGVVAVGCVVYGILATGTEATQASSPAE